MNKFDTDTSRRIGTVLLLLIVMCSPVAADGKSELTNEALVEALRVGGYNIYFRHAQTDWSQVDQVDQAGDWTSCDPSRMRQLSDEGRHTSKVIGDAIRLLGIPVSRVLASPYCRTVETASLMNIGKVETTTDIMNLRSSDYFGGRDVILQSARSRLAKAPPAGTNIVFVGHGNVAREATPVYPNEGEGVVFRPLGDSSFTVLGRLTSELWSSLAAKLAN
ncbi:MAG: histidine phosphatase family protein [Arenicellales bacterium]|nr:histidine phosphatase family protein [Arenicellales bacterium]